MRSLVFVAVFAVGARAFAPPRVSERSSTAVNQATEAQAAFFDLVKVDDSVAVATGDSVAVAAMPEEPVFVRGDFTQEMGAMAPLGFFDPLNLLKDADQERFDRLRFVEVKHGRISMLAILGQIATRQGHFLNGNIDYEGHPFNSYPSGIAALWGPDAIPKGGLYQIILLIGFLEVGVMKDIKEMNNEFPGDFRNGVAKASWDRLDPATKLQKRSIELNNGRAAMMGILALMVHEQLHTNMPIIGQL